MRTIARVSAGFICLCFARAGVADDLMFSRMAAITEAPTPHQPAMMPTPPPIGIVGGRVVKPGQVMLNYQFAHTEKRRLLDGDDGLSTTKVATLPNHFAGQPGQPATYRVAPENMSIDTHMFGVQVGITQKLSAAVGVPYLIKEREAVTFAGPAGTTKLGTFQNETSGIGDVAASGLYKLYDDETHHIHVMFGLSFPTGSIREDGRTLAPDGTTSRRRLAYGLQLGTGTYDLLPGVTYWGAAGRWNWGAQVLGRIHLGDNDEGYSFGDRVYATGWGGYSLGLGFNASARLIQEYQSDIDGEDDFLTGPTPTTDPNNYGGWKTSAAVGIGYRVPDGPLAGLNPGVEVSLPLYQNLNGPQLSDSWSVLVGVRKVFTFSTPG